MSGLPPCIYCGSPEPPREKREHVLPQSYGLFEDNWVLDCVCDSCNQYFGDKIRSVVFAQVSLFNEITYVVRFCRYYSGVWRDVASGHLFDPFEHRIVQLANARSLVVPRFSV